MKDFINFLKECLKNKKTRAIYILILYIIFFIFVFALFSSYNKSNKVTDQFSYLKTNEIVEYRVSGDLNFTVNDNIIFNEIIYEKNEIIPELSNFDFNLINNNNIYKLVKNSVLESTNYLDNSNTYAIKITDFEKLIYNKEVTNDEYIRITLLKNNITLDLTNYNGYKISIDLRS